MNRPVHLSNAVYETIPRKSVSKKFIRSPFTGYVSRRRVVPSLTRYRICDASGQKNIIRGLQSPEEKVDLPTQGQSAVAGVQLREKSDPEKKQSADLEYLSELLAIQQNGPKAVGFFGTRNMGVTHQKLVEILSYALVLTAVVSVKGNHVYTSGAIGTNAAVIRGALRAEKPEKLTVVLPQSLRKQPQESQELLKQVQNIVEMPWNNDLSLFDASKLCNQNILMKVQQVICFVFHDSRLMLETCEEARKLRKIVTLFYLD